MKIYQEPKAMPGEFEVGQELGLVDGQELFACLDFDHDRPFNNQIHAETGIDTDASASLRLCGSSAAEVLDAWGSTILGSVGEDLAPLAKIKRVLSLRIP